MQDLKVPQEKALGFVWEKAENIISRNMHEVRIADCDDHSCSHWDAAPR